MKKRRKLLRPVTRLAKSVQRQLKSTSQTLSRSTSVLLHIRETPVVTGGGVTRQKPSWTNYFNPLFWIQQCFGFTTRYFRSRNVIAAIAGVPAMLGLVAPVIAAFWFMDPVEERARYAEDQMRYFKEKKEFKAADFYARQLCILLDQDANGERDRRLNEVLFARAELLDEISKSDEEDSETDGEMKSDAKSKARAIVEQLVASEYLRAVEWLCREELLEISKLEAPDAKREQQLESLLTWLIDEQPDHPNANFMLGTLRLMRKQYVNAIRPLQMATRSDELSNSPEAWYSLATCLKETGDVRGSQRTASTAADLYLEQAHLEAYDLNKLLATLRAFVLAAREEEAADRLTELIPQWPEEEQRPQLISLLGDVHAERCKRLRTKDDRSPRDFAEAMNAIMRAIQVAPQNRVVIEELVQLTCSPDVDDKQLDQHLTIAQDSGVASGVIHFIRGTRLQLADPPDPVTADIHFRIAEQDGFNMPGLWNNMADAMFENNDADLDKALALVNRAIQAMPDQPYFFDTRGKILLRQQKSVEAIADLEKALAAPELRESIHVRLAKAWSFLGNESEAARHRELAEQIGQANTVRESPRTDGAADDIAPGGADGINQPLPAPDESSSPIEQTVVDSLK